MSYVINKHMTGKTSYRELHEVFYYWLNGKGYETLSKETGVSIGKISEVLKVVNAAIPDIEELRKLKMEQNTKKISTKEAADGIVAQNTLRSLNLTMNNVAESVSLLKHYGVKAPSVLERGEYLWEIEERVGKKYDLIVDEAEKKSLQIASMDNETKDLLKKKSDLEEAMPELESLKKLKSRLDSYQLSAEKLDGFIDYQLWLQKSGFTSDTAKLFASTLKNEGLDPKSAAEIFPSLIIKGKNFSASIKEKEMEHAQLATQVGSKKELLERLTDNEKDLKHNLEVLQGSIAQNKASLDDIERKIADKNNEKASIEEKMRELETSIKKYEEEVHGKMLYRIFVSLTETPTARLDRLELINALFGLSEGVKIYVDKFPSEFYLSDALREIFRSLAGNLLEELQHAKQPTS